MKRKIVLVPALAMLVLLAPIACQTANADGCVTRSFSYGSVYHAPYVAPTYQYRRAVVEVIPVAVYQPVPTFSVTYAPGYGGPPGPGQDTQALMSTIKGLQQQISVLSTTVQGMRQQFAQPQPAQANVQPQQVQPVQQQPPQAAPQGKEIGWVNVLTTRCASCHTAGRAKGNLTLFTQANQLAQLTPAQIGKCIMRMQQAGTKEQMPPLPAQALTDQEFSEVNLGLARLLSKTVAQK